MFLCKENSNGIEQRSSFISILYLRRGRALGRISKEKEKNYWISTRSLACKENKKLKLKIISDKFGL